MIPARNEADLDDVPEAVREAMTIHLASHVGEVLGWALEPAPEVAAVREAWARVGVLGPASEEDLFA